MNRSTKFAIYLAGYIVVLFSVGMAFTFINDALQVSGFFGDTVFKPYTTFYGSVINTYGAIDDSHVWGARHYWYFWMCVCLFILSVVRVFIWCVLYWDKKAFD